MVDRHARPGPGLDAHRVPCRGRHRRRGRLRGRRGSSSSAGRPAIGRPDVRRISWLPAIVIGAFAVRWAFFWRDALTMVRTACGGAHQHLGRLAGPPRHRQFVRRRRELPARASALRRPRVRLSLPQRPDRRRWRDPRDGPGRRACVCTATSCASSSPSGCMPSLVGSRGTAAPRPSRSCCSCSVAGSGGSRPRPRWSSRTTSSGRSRRWPGSATSRAT